MRYNLAVAMFHRVISLGFVSVALTACVAREPAATGDEGSSSDTGGTTPEPTSATTSTTTSSTDATTAEATTAEATTDATTGADGSSGSESFSFITAPDFGDGGVRDLPNGDPCQDAAECASGFCRDAPGPGDGVCSECEMDADCDGGTCSFEFDAGYAVCTDGALGDGCDSDEGCAGALVCARQFGDAGPRHCSECGPELACAGETVCAPVYEDDSPFQGYLGCIVPGTVEAGGGCPVVDAIGDGAVCSSNACAVVSLMGGNLPIGVCSDCVDDSVCLDGQTCQPPEIDQQGITPGMCG